MKLRNFFAVFVCIIIVGIGSSLIIFGCANQSEHLRYLSDLEAWKSERIKSVSAPYGWPSVIGLFPINNSLQYVGSSKDSDFVLPNTAPPSLGVVEKHRDSIVMKSAPDIRMIVDQKPLRSVRLLSDQDENGPTMVSWKNLQWYLIKRQNTYFLRVKDTLSLYRTRFDSIAYFPVDTAFRFEAHFEPADPADSTQYDNILGMSFTAPVAGYLNFTFQGKEHSLTALKNDDSTFFVLFADHTTARTTYPGGRYLYPKKAGPNGKTWLDFNRAINPPCVFTPYATCPLPPRENHLPFEVRAGEKNLKLY